MIYNYKDHLLLESIAKDLNNLFVDNPCQDNIDWSMKIESIKNFDYIKDKSPYLRQFVDNPTIDNAKKIIREYGSNSYKDFYDCFSPSIKWKLLIVKIINKPENIIFKEFKYIKSFPDNFSYDIESGRGDVFSSKILNEILIQIIRITPNNLFYDNQLPLFIKYSDYIFIDISEENYFQFIDMLRKIYFIDPYIPIITNYNAYLNSLEENIPKNIYTIAPIMRNEKQKKLNASNILDMMVLHHRLYNLYSKKSIHKEKTPDEIKKDLIKSAFTIPHPKIKKAPHGFSSAKKNFWVEYGEKKLRFVKIDQEMNILEEYKRYSKFVDGSLENITGRIIDKPFFSYFYGAIKYSVAGSLRKIDTKFPIMQIEEGLLCPNKTKAAGNAFKWIIETIKQWWWVHTEKNKTIFKPFYGYGENLPPLIAGVWVDKKSEEIDSNKIIDGDNFSIKMLKDIYKYQEKSGEILEIRNISLLNIRQKSKNVEGTFLLPKYGIKIRVHFSGKTLQEFKGKFRNRKIFSEIYIKTDNTIYNLWKCLKEWLDNFEDLRDWDIHKYIKTIFGFTSICKGISSWETITHGDLHYKNMLFEPSNEDDFRTAWLIDFEKTRKAYASLDLVVLEVALRTSILSVLLYNQNEKFFATTECVKRQECLNKNHIKNCLIKLESILWEYFKNPGRNIPELPSELKCMHNIVGYTTWNIFCYIRKTAFDVGISLLEYSCGLALYPINFANWLNNPKDAQEETLKLAKLCAQVCFKFHLLKFEELIIDEKKPQDKGV